MTRLIPGSFDGSSSWSLRAVDREAFKRWVLLASVITAAGYLVVFAANALLHPDRYHALISQAATIVVALIAFGYAHEGHLHRAVFLLIGAVWLELHASIPFEGLQPSSLPVFPLLVMAVGFPLGGWGSFLAASVTTVTLAGTVAFSHGVLGVPWPEPIWTIYYLLVTSACMFVAAAFVHVGVEALGRIVQTARASEARVTDILAHAPDGVLALGTAGRVQTVNPAAEEALGAPADLLLGRSFREILRERVRPADWGRLDLPISGRHGVTDTFPLRRPDAEPIWVEIVSREVRWEDGNEGIQVSLRDVTERRAARDREEELRSQLEHAQRLEAVGRLAGGVAHDFNNLLTVVGGSAEILHQEVDADLRSLVEEIIKAKERGADLVRRLLAFARKEVIQPRWLDVGELLEETRILLVRLLSEDVELEVEVDDRTPRIWADAGQIEQVVVNLVSNARDAMSRPGTIRVRASGPGRSLEWPGAEPLEIPEGYVALAVEDEGEGMSDDVRERVFEPFFTTKPRGSGTGLGLSTVHGILNQNGGSVLVDSEVGVGTRITTLWPTSSEARETETAPLVGEGAAP